MMSKGFQESTTNIDDDKFLKGASPDMLLLWNTVAAVTS